MLLSYSGSLACLGLEIKLFQKLHLEMYRSPPNDTDEQFKHDLLLQVEKAPLFHSLPPAQEGKSSWDILGFASRVQGEGSGVWKSPRRCPCKGRLMPTGIPRMLHVWQ